MPNTTKTNITYNSSQIFKMLKTINISQTCFLILKMKYLLILAISIFTVCKFHPMVKLGNAFNIVVKAEMKTCILLYSYFFI